MRVICTILAAVLAAVAATAAHAQADADIRTRLERWVEEGRTLADEAAEEAERLTGEAAAEAERLTTEAEARLDSLQIYLEGEAAALGDLTDDQVRQFLDELGRTEALIADAGYRLERIDVAPLRLVPYVVLHCRFERALSEDEATALLARIDGDGVVPTVQRTVIGLLLRASAYNEDVDVGGFRLDTVRVSLSVPPGAVLVYQRRD